ncbi:MAG: TonB-dependent receptor plug domain-containing protein, partial [Syntrophothermus sp.]
MKKILFFFLMISMVFPAFSQKVVVLDKSDLRAIPQVTISNPLKTLMVTTNNKGEADLGGFSSQDSLVFSHVAFQVVKMKKSELNAQKVYLTENIIKLDEFVFTANRHEEKKADLPYKIEVIPAKQIAFLNTQTSTQLLEQTGEAFVQQSQLGGGSPVLRGFEANKVLLIVDGVRLNNAIYRAGHLQNAISVDPFILSSMEIIYGPGSVIHGSDALGGVISFRTREPLLSGNGFTVTGDALARYGSANTEKTGGINLNLGWKKMAVLFNASYSDFGDLRQGKLRNPFYGDWGKRTFYVERINGSDSALKNDKPEIQKQSAYSQINLMGKVLYRPSSAARYLLNIQYSASSDIPRYDRLTDTVDNGKPKYAEWYYGPQKRFLASLNAEYRLKSLLFDVASVNLAYQNVHEDRINRSFGKSKKKFNLETVDVLSFNADLNKKLAKKDDLQYGLEATYNKVTSVAHQENIVTGAITNDLATRYPDDKANMMTVAAYLSNKWMINKLLTFSQGLRFSYVALNAAYSDTMMSIMKFPFDNTIEQKSSALNGYVGLVATPEGDWKISLVGSTGFRAPNIDDLTRLSESNSQDKMIIVPNPDLKPEYAYNAELSVGKTIAGAVRLEASGFYTWLRDALIVAPSTYNGQDSLMYDGTMSKVFSTQNGGSANIYGVQGTLLAQVTRIFSISSNVTWTKGRLTDQDHPLDHIPPVYGMTSFNLEMKKFHGSFYVMYNGWKRLSDYSDSGEDNLNYATVNGTPSWYTLNLKASYQVIKNLSVELGVENILDE